MHFQATITANIDINMRARKSSHQWSSPKEADLNTTMRNELDWVTATALDIEGLPDLHRNRVSRNQVTRRVFGTQTSTVSKAQRNLWGVQGMIADPGMEAVVQTEEEMEDIIRHERRGGGDAAEKEEKPQGSSGDYAKRCVFSFLSPCRNDFFLFQF